MERLAYDKLGEKQNMKFCIIKEGNIMGKEEKVFSSFPTMFSTVDIVRLELTFLTSFRFTKLRRLIDRTTWKRK